MDLDIVIYFYKTLKNGLSNKNDSLLMSSYVKNKIIDIRLTLREHFLMVKNNPEYNNISINIDKILNKDDYILDIPIYLLLLKENFYHVILIAIENQLLSDDEIIIIVESILESINYEEKINENEYFFNLLDILSYKIINLDKNSFIISNFINDNIYLFKNNECDEYNDKYIKKICLCLLYYGYCNLDSIKEFNGDNNVIDDIIIPLFYNKYYNCIMKLIDKYNFNEDEIISLEKFIGEMKLSQQCFEDEEQVNDILNLLNKKY